MVGWINMTLTYKHANPTYPATHTHNMHVLEGTEGKRGPKKMQKWPRNKDLSQAIRSSLLKNPTHNIIRKMAEPLMLI
jgi:hypothetical protein